MRGRGIVLSAAPTSYSDHLTVYRADNECMEDAREHDVGLLCQLGSALLTIILVSYWSRGLSCMRAVLPPCLDGGTPFHVLGRVQAFLQVSRNLGSDRTQTQPARVEPTEMIRYVAKTSAETIVIALPIPKHDTSVRNDRARCLPPNGVCLNIVLWHALR